jgi:hypothetical protein
MKLILCAILLLASCSCGIPRTGILIPKGDVFYHYNYGIGISNVKVNGISRENGWNSLLPGTLKITFNVGFARLSAETQIQDGKRYVLICDQSGHGSAARMSCKIIEYNE